MEALKAFLDAIKTTTYSMFAVLLPGAAVVEIAVRVMSIDSIVMKAGALSYLAVAYVVGMAVQGAASFLFARRPLRRLNDNAKWREPEEHAKRILEAKLGEKIARERVLDLCLSRVEPRREGYDKFIALRDMSRGLVLVSVLAATVIVIRHGRELWTMRYGSAFVASLLGAAAFAERYSCFAPLGRRVVYSQFVAGEIKVDKKSESAKVVDV